VLTDDQRRTLDEAGYVVLPGILSEQECDLWSRTIDDVWEQERTRAHKYREEPGVRFTDNLLRHSQLFEKCMSDPTVLDGVRAVLGQDIVLSLINARRSDPGYGNQALHDLKRERGVPFRWCNTMWCLDEFTSVNGATRVIPRSHMSGEPFLSRCEDSLLPHPDECFVEAPRGGVVIFNSHLIHGGSTNHTDTPRRCVHSSFARVGEQPYYDWNELPSAIQSGLTPTSRQLLGLEANTVTGAT